MTPTIDTIIAEMRKIGERLCHAGYYGAGSEIADLADGLAALPAPGEWLPMDSAPKDGRWILMWQQNVAKFYAEKGWPYVPSIVRWLDDEWRDIDDCRMRQGSNWQQLPAAPLAAAQGECNE